MNQWKLEANVCCELKARVYVLAEVTIGFVLSSDWMTKWHVFSLDEPIAKQESLLRQAAFSRALHLSFT